MKTIRHNSTKAKGRADVRGLSLSDCARVALRARRAHFRRFISCGYFSKDSFRVGSIRTAVQTVAGGSKLTSL